jgi:hypothetical protein
MATIGNLAAEQANLMGTGAVPVVHEDDGYASTDGQAIYVNPSFISSVESAAGEGGVRFVIAHELGHIAQGMGGGHSAELEADQFAARSLAAAGFEQEAISGVMSILPSDTSETHPGSATREGVALKAFNSERATIDDDDTSKKKVSRNNVKANDR